MSRMAGAEEPPTKKKKEASFAEDELLMLVTEVAKRRSVICGSFSSDVSRKTNDAVNSVS